MELNILANPDANAIKNRCPLPHSEEKGMANLYP